MITLSLKPADLSSATPPQIDADLFETIKARYALEDEQANLVLRIHQDVDSRDYRRAGAPWRLTDRAALDLAESKRAEDARIAAVLDRLAAMQVEHSALLQAAEPLIAEYHRRGGWTRAYLVDNPDGHLHKSDNCPTLHKGNFMTRLFWITEVSGQDEAQIVEAAGEKACTVCYPSAPVNILKRPSRFEGPNMKAAREERETRAAEKAIRDAAKAEKAITNPDGTVLRGKHGRINTVVSAWRELIDIIASHRLYNFDFYPVIQQRIVAALAAKTGQSEDEILAEVEKKVAAKIKRESR